VPEVTSHLVSRISYPKLETPKRGFRGPGCMTSWVTRRSYSGLIGGEILTTCDHRDGRKDQFG
jgi:hypothetical protein